MLEFIPIIGKIIDRVFPDPQEAADAKVAVEEAVAKTEAARAAEFAEFIKATQPTADRVYIWANTAIALVRPGMAIFSLLAPFVWPAPWADFMKAMAENAPWSVVALSPLVVWVLGRDGLRMVLGLVSVVKNGGRIPAEVMPEGLEKIAPPRLSAPFTSGTGFKKELPGEK